MVIIDTDSANHWWGVGKREPTKAPGAWKLGQVLALTYWLDDDRSRRHVIIQCRHGITQCGISLNHSLAVFSFHKVLYMVTRMIVINQ